ncbi:MAG: hypothetical protein AAB699_00500 [Patescibacteria group bacterium]
MPRCLCLFVIFAALALAVFAPLSSRAVTEADITKTKGAYEQAVVPCGYTVTETKSVDGGQVTTQRIYNPCDFNDIIVLGARLITGWIVIGVTIATMGFAYAGYLYMTAMGSEEKIKHAHSIFYKVALGFVFMLSAWLIAKVLEQTFLTPEQQAQTFLK